MKKILIALHLVSIGLLIPGLIMNILRIDITASFFIDINLFNEGRSVLGTLESLWQSGAGLAFFLILIFGLLVPLGKSVIIIYLLLTKTPAQKWSRLLASISKWAMADVFAVSILIAFLGANAMSHTKATLEPGFYFFTAYVLLSALIVSLLPKQDNYPPVNQA